MEEVRRKARKEKQKGRIIKMNRTEHSSRIEAEVIEEEVDDLI